jgi:arylsulfatase A-like enzyme
MTRLRHRSDLRLRPRWWRRVAAAGMLAAAALLLPGCPAKPPDPARPDIVLVVVDTLRADHLGAYGYKPPTSPQIDTLASRGVIFASAWGAAPWTLPSVMSIVTGRTPSSHRVENDGLRLPSDIPTLPQILKERGYATGGFVSHIYVTAPYGFERGFEKFDDFGLTRPGYRLESRFEPPADQVTDAALDWLRRQGGRPVFLMVHYFDAHWPYEPPEATRDLFPAEYHGALDATWESLSRFQDPAVPLPDDYRAFLLARYDGEIRFVDAQIGRLVEGIEKAGRSGRTWVVVTADHGEEFKDHRSIGHGRQMYEEVLHVPLVVVPPRGALTGAPDNGADQRPAGHKVTTPVSGIDLLPTFAAIAGAPAPAGVEGRSLLPLLRGAVGGADRPVISETVRLNAYRRAVREGDLKLIHVMDESRSELYDLAADPLEQHDLARARPEDRARLTRVLFARPDLLAGGWNVRWRGDGRGRRFDGRIRTSGIFRSVVALSHDGGAYRLEQPDTLSFADLDEKGENGLVFTVAPETATVTFDLRVDGRPRPEQVRLGRDGKQAAQIPLTLEGALEGNDALFTPPPDVAGKSSGAAAVPGFRLWRTRPAAPDQPVTLDDETRERLHSLGYID